MRKYFRSTAVQFVLSRALLAALLISGVVFTATPATAQRTNGSADTTQEAKNLSEIIRSLEKKWVNYHFLYDAEKLKTRTAVAEPDIANHSLQQVLQELNKAGLITYRIDNNVISIALLPLRKKAGNGIITGRVTDKDNDDPISGATIKIGIQSVVTDAEGIFTIELPKGKYDAEISSVGYGRKKMSEVEIKDHEALSLEIGLSRIKGQLQSVVVKAAAGRESVNTLYMRQKNNAAITDGISAEQIRRSADRDASQVLRRVAGVSVVDNKFVVVRGLGERYNQAALNNQLMPSTEINRKNFSFNVIPSNIIERITIMKTLTPDRSAEFGGALVDVKTVDIPAKNFFTISVGANYNDQTTGKDYYTLKLEGKEYFGEVSDHRRFLGKAKWNSQTAMTDAWQARKAESGGPANFLNNNWGITRFKAPLSPNFQATFGSVISRPGEQQWGVTAAVGYRSTLQSQEIKMGKNYYSYYDSATSVYRGAQGYQSDFITNLSGLLGVAYKNARNTIAFRSLYIRNYEQSFAIADSGSHNNYGANTMGYYDKAGQNTIWQNQVAGEHLAGHKGIKINWLASYTDLDILKPDNHFLTYSGASQRRTGQYWNDFNVVGNGMSNLSAGVLRSWSRAREKNFYWDLSVSVPIKLTIGNLDLNNLVKTGYSGWNKNRYFYVLNTGTMLKNPSAFLKPLGDVFTPEYGVETFASNFNDAFVSPAAQLHAGYLMLDNKLGKKFRLIWGLRGEYFDLNSQKNLIFEKLESQNFDVSNLKSQEPAMQWFPSANLVYSLTKNMNLRLAYSKSIIRPDLREMSYLNEYDFELGGSYEVANLRSTIINHYDFRYEWYPVSGSVLTTSLYYKKLNYPMEIYKEPNNSYVLRNSKYAKNWGVEMELRQSLSHITQLPVLRNLTVYGNFAWLGSRILQKKDGASSIDLPDGTRKVILEEKLALHEISRPQAGASNWLVNAGLYYDSKIFSASLLYNYMSSRAFVAASIPGESIFERPPTSLDAQLGVHLLQRKMKITMNISNLLNRGLFQYRPTHLASQGEDVSVSRKEFLYRKGNEVFFEGRPGKTYGFSISYHL